MKIFIFLVLFLMLYFLMISLEIADGTPEAKKEA